MVKIEELTQVTSDDLGGINKLIPQLSATAKPLTYQGLVEILKDSQNGFFVARLSGKIVGMGMALVHRVATEKRARFEEIVVDSEHRKLGIGTMIMEKLLEFAKKERVSSVYFNSNPGRAAANALYKKMGFEPYETNVYRMKL